MQFRHILIALIVPITWGFGFTFAKASLGYFPPLLLMGLRFLLAATLLVCFVPIPRGHLWALSGISFIAATLQYGLTYSGLALMEATPAVLLVQSEVIFGVIIATILLGEKPNIRQLFGIVVALVGVAKGPDRDAGRERFFRHGEDDFMLPTNSPVLYYLQRLRDEAHRFAIGGHRAKRQKDLRRNALDQISGIGAGRKRALLHLFGSARAVGRAALGDLEKVDGISAKMAKTIYDHFHGEGQ